MKKRNWELELDGDRDGGRYRESPNEWEVCTADCADKVVEIKNLLELSSTPNGGTGVTDELKYTGGRM